MGACHLSVILDRPPAYDLRKQAQTPLLDAMVAYRRQGVTRFHMPGHRGGHGADWRLRELLGDSVFALDVTGVPGLDDLHQPSGPIRRAQELAAEAFGADHSFFLINGSTVGVQAMILAACEPKDKIIVARNVHKSILSAIILSGTAPIFVQPEVDPDFGIPMGVSPQAVAGALDRHPDARAVVLVSPTYHGFVADIAAIAEEVHRRGKVLLVDEAHGPHLGFHEELPLPSLLAGADACTQGVHKMLGGFTQASILHLRGERIDPARVRAVLRLLQSTSASYLLMASIDVARMQMATSGRQLLGRALELAHELRTRIEGVDGLQTFGPERARRPGAVGLDPTKVTVGVWPLGLTGHVVEGLLRDVGPLQAEMSDLLNVLFIVGFGNTSEELERLARALQYVARHAGSYRSARLERLVAAARVASRPLPLPELEVLPREAFFARSRPLALEQAEGAVSAEMVACYPPGIPILCPGERISAAAVSQLMLVREAELSVSGPRDPGLRTLQVL